MHILLTGGSGFVGSFLVPKLLDLGFQLSLTTSQPLNALPKVPFAHRVQWFHLDLMENKPIPWANQPFDLLLHLAWPKLNNYHDTDHLNTILPAHLSFIKTLLQNGLPRLMALGTCLEYGMVYGPIPASHPTKPISPYGSAKDILHKELIPLCLKHHTGLQWLRLFYLYGNPPRTGTLLHKLETAIHENQSVFPMTMGEQLRDFIPLELLAQQVVQLIHQPQRTGAFNVCSGVPVSVRRFVEQYLQQNGHQIQLDLGKIPYPDYEPLAFWGVPDI